MKHFIPKMSKKISDFFKLAPKEVKIEPSDIDEDSQKYENSEINLTNVKQEIPSTNSTYRSRFSKRTPNHQQCQAGTRKEFLNQT